MFSSHTNYQIALQLICIQEGWSKMLTYLRCWDITFSPKLPLRPLDTLGGYSMTHHLCVHWTKYLSCVFLTLALSFFKVSNVYKPCVCCFTELPTLYITSFDLLVSLARGWVIFCLYGVTLVFFSPMLFLLWANKRLIHLKDIQKRKIILPLSFRNK